MTRSVSLADLMPSRVAPTAKPAVVSASTEDGLESGGTTCFAQVLENAGSADRRTEKENRQEERVDDACPGTDQVATVAAGTVSGETAPPVTGPAVPSLASTQPPPRVLHGPAMPAAPLVLNVEVPHNGERSHDYAASRGDVVPHKTATPYDRPTAQVPVPHLAPGGPAPQTPSPPQGAAPLLNHAAPPPGTTATISDDPPAQTAPPIAAAVSPASGAVASSAATQTLRVHAGAPATAYFSEATTEPTASPRPPQDESADARQAPAAPGTTVARPVASPPPQAVGSTNLPASPHGDAGKQLRDSDAGADNGAGQVPGHVPTTAATGSQPVVPESMSTPVVTTNSGEFAISLDHATVQPPRSDFVVSNTVLTATISKPLSEGNGTYSVTAMLNPPSLGHVQAVVKVDGANVNVAIVAHTPEGHHAIAAHLDELRSELQARGGNVQLSLSDGGAKGGRRDQSEPPPATAQDSEETDTLVLTVAPAHGAQSLHVIL